MLKKSTKIHGTKTIIIYTFTVQLYNISTRSNTLENIQYIQLALHRHVAQYSNQNYMMTKIRFVCTYAELRLKCKGFNLDCNRETWFVLQCTRQLSTAGMWRYCVCCRCVSVCLVEIRAQTLVRWQAESLYIQSSLVNKMWLWAQTGDWHSEKLTDIARFFFTTA